MKRAATTFTSCLTKVANTWICSQPAAYRDSKFDSLNLQGKRAQHLSIEDTFMGFMGVDEDDKIKTLTKCVFAGVEVNFCLVFHRRSFTDVQS